MKKVANKLVMFTAKAYREPSGDKPCNGLEKWGRQEIGKICAGSLIMAANMCKRPRDPNFPKLPSDRESVFANHLEFIKHHEDAPVRSWESTESHELRSKPVPKKQQPKQSARDAYVEAVRFELEDADKLSREEYVDALEELASEIEAMLDAARSDLQRASTGRRKGR